MIGGGRFAASGDCVRLVTMCARREGTPLVMGVVVFVEFVVVLSALGVFVAAARASGGRR